MSIQPHIHVAQVAPRVVVCGEPNRANRIASLLNNAELVAENREYRLFSGEFEEQPITVCSTGIGAPSMIIAVEELARSGAKAIVRVGSAGAMQSEIGLGELIWWKAQCVMRAVQRHILAPLIRLTQALNWWWRCNAFS